MQVGRKTASPVGGGGGREGAQREISLTSSQVRSVQIGQCNAKEGANHMPPGPWPLMPL